MARHNPFIIRKYNETPKDTHHYTHSRKRKSAEEEKITDTPANHTGRSPTGATSEAPVNVAAMPWQGDAEGKYKYHPGGDPSAAPRDAPSALNTVIIPNVTAPKEAHDKFNKWGKEGYP